MKMDLTLTPFSRRGSYLAVSRLGTMQVAGASGPGLWIRTVRELFRPGALFRIEAAPHDSFTDAALPEELRLTPAGGGLVRIGFDGPDCLRVRAERCLVRLAAPGGGVGEGASIAGATGVTQITPAGQERWRVVAGITSVFSLRRLSGDVRVRSRWDGRGSVDNVVELDGRDGVAEVALRDLHGTESDPPVRRSFDESSADARASFEEYLSRQMPCAERYEETRGLAAYVNWSCLVEPDGFLRREGMVMSKNWMNGIWSWDHCFNALALRHGDPELAWNLFMTQFDHQNAEGALPDMVSPGSVIRTFVKPPIHGWAFRHLYVAAPEVYEGVRLHEAYEALEAWTRFWTDHRDPFATGLPVYYHGNDSGWDNATPFLAGSPITTADLPAFLVLQMDALAELAELLGNRAASARWRTEADELLTRTVATLRRADRWVSLTPADPAAEPSQGSDSLLPYEALVLADRLPEEALRRSITELSQPGRFVTEHGLATESLASPLLSDDGYWRGPVWAPSTMLVVDGLDRSSTVPDAAGLSRTVAEGFCATCAEQGFAENFDPVTGAGLRDRAYTWTASVFLELAGRGGTER